MISFRINLVIFLALVYAKMTDIKFLLEQLRVRGSRLQDLETFAQKHQLALQVAYGKERENEEEPNDYQFLLYTIARIKDLNKECHKALLKMNPSKSWMNVHAETYHSIILGDFTNYWDLKNPNPDEPYLLLGSPSWKIWKEDLRPMLQFIKVYAIFSDFELIAVEELADYFMGL